MRDDGLLPIDPDLSPEDPGEPSLLHHPVPHVHRARQLAVLGAIAAGGFIGALARYEVSIAWKAPSGELPWATWAINTSGAFFIGFVLTVLLRKARSAGSLRPFLCTGLLGAWTTMSTFAVETDLLLKDGQWGVAVGYVCATVVAGLTFTWAGIAVGRWVAVPGRARWS